MYRDCFAHLYDDDVERRRIPPTPYNDLRLHRLERPEPWPAELMWAIRAAIGDIQKYPDYTVFYDRLAEFVGRPKEQIVVGAGIEDFIRSLIWLTCDPGDVFAYTWPTCAMFDIYAKVFGAEPLRIVPSPDKWFTIADLIETMPVGQARLLILPNPGQPVETYFNPDELAQLADHCRAGDTVLAIDEAYHGFGAATALELVDRFDNVVVLRTFSKAFGAAGIRIGYAIGPRSVIQPLDAIRLSGEVAGPSMAAATVLMDRWGRDVVPGIAQVVAGRDWLRERLTADGFEVRGEHANHVLVHMGDAETAFTVAERLRFDGVHVRLNSPPLERYMMITCGSRPLMQRFYEAFKRAL